MLLGVSHNLYNTSCLVILVWATHVGSKLNEMEGFERVGEISFSRQVDLYVISELNTVLWMKSR